MIRKILSIVLIVLLSASCATARKGLALGAITGGAGGTFVGAKLVRAGKRENAFKGAVIGGLLGLAAGYFIHGGLEKRDEKTRRKLLLNLEKFGIGRAMGVQKGGNPTITRPVVESEWVETKVKGNKLIEAAPGMVHKGKLSMDSRRRGKKRGWKEMKNLRPLVLSVFAFASCELFRDERPLPSDFSGRTEGQGEISPFAFRELMKRERLTTAKRWITDEVRSGDFLVITIHEAALVYGEEIRPYDYFYKVHFYRLRGGGRRYYR